LKSSRHLTARVVFSRIDGRISHVSLCACLAVKFDLFFSHV